MEPTRRQWAGFWSMIVQQTQNAFNDKFAQFTLIPLGGAVGFVFLIPVGKGVEVDVPSAAGLMIALPFVLFRAWKIPVGHVMEEIRLYGPSGRMVWRWGPEYRRMAGAFDLTTELDLVTDAACDETGTYIASFSVDDQVVGDGQVGGQ